MELTATSQKDWNLLLFLHYIQLKKINKKSSVPQFEAEDVHLLLFPTSTNPGTAFCTHKQEL